MAKRVARRGSVDTTKLRNNLAKAGRARRSALSIKATPATKSVGEQIAKLAGKRGLVVEWTLRPVDVSESVGVHCFCGCGCSCIA